MVKELRKAGTPGSLPPTWDSAELELHVLEYKPLHVTETQNLPRKPLSYRKNLTIMAQTPRAPACKRQNMDFGKLSSQMLPNFGQGSAHLKRLDYVPTF